MSTSIDLYWRPGCGFCHRLPADLDRAGIERTEHNGNETVPTVVIGRKGLVNPTRRGRCPHNRRRDHRGRHCRPRAEINRRRHR